MKLTPSQRTAVTEILNGMNKDNIQSIGNTNIIVEIITRSQVLDLDRLLGTRGIVIEPNDTKTIKIVIL